MKHYVLVDKVAVEEPDLLTWAVWFQTANRRVAATEFGAVRVSTVFLGLDHRFMDRGPPVLFESMVFGGELDGEQDRCSTWDEAETMHRAMCDRVRRTFLKVVGN